MCEKPTLGGSRVHNNSAFPRQLCYSLFNTHYKGKIYLAGAVYMALILPKVSVFSFPILLYNDIHLYIKRYWLLQTLSTPDTYSSCTANASSSASHQMQPQLFFHPAPKGGTWGCRPSLPLSVTLLQAEIGSKLGKTQYFPSKGHYPVKLFNVS